MADSAGGKVKALVLAAGYGTRLGRDIEADQSGKFAHLKGVPKPLLPIGGKPLITRWMNQLNACEVVDEVYVVVGRPVRARSRRPCYVVSGSGERHHGGGAGKGWLARATRSFLPQPQCFV